MAAGATLMSCLTPVLFVFLASVVRAAAPVCRATQILASSNGSDGAMGSQYAQAVFANTSAVACQLDIHDFHFERLDSGGHHLPIKVRVGMDLNAYGAGVPVIVLNPKQSMALSIRTANRTGYDESRHCATRVQITMFKRRLVDIKTISCDQNVDSTGFYPVEPR